jgi:hypothetical protein
MIARRRGPVADVQRLPLLREWRGFQIGVGAMSAGRGFVAVGLTFIAFALVVVSAAAPPSAASISARSAIIVGRVLFAGGPSVPVSRRRRGGTVVLRARSGRLVATARATRRHGFRLRVMPGRYFLSARGTDCPHQPVEAKPHRKVHVDVTVGCLVR